MKLSLPSTLLAAHIFHHNGGDKTVRATPFRQRQGTDGARESKCTKRKTNWKMSIEEQKVPMILRQKMNKTVKGKEDI